MSPTGNLPRWRFTRRVNQTYNPSHEATSRARQLSPAAREKVNKVLAKGLQTMPGGFVAVYPENPQYLVYVLKVSREPDVGIIYRCDKQTGNDICFSIADFIGDHLDTNPDFDPY